MKQPRNPPLRPAVAYLRVSTAEQADRYGLDAQRAAIEQFAQRERLRLVATYADPGVSGTVPLAERPGLSDALAAVKAGRADVLVVARFDRLARKTMQALLAEDEFSRAGAAVLYAEGTNGEDDEFMRQVMHAMAEEQRRQLVARLAAGRRAKAASGGYAGGRPAFGYRAERGKLVPDSDEAAVVRWVFEKVADDCWSIRKVARELDRAGTLGRRWDPTTVATILRRADYKRNGARIVDPRIWNRARAVLAERTPTVAA